MEQESCFICADDCSNSHLFLVNLISKKFKTKYTDLIGDFINPDYELRIQKENKICHRCNVLLDRYDELQHETSQVKSVVSRALAFTYQIESSEPMIYMDKSKIFIELGSADNISYTCKLCTSFNTNSIEIVNTHILYHKIVTESKIKAQEFVKELKEPKQTLPAIRRETPKPLGSQNYSVKQQTALPLQSQRIQESKTGSHQALPQGRSKVVPEITEISQQQEFDEDYLETLIDMELVIDPQYDSNVKNQMCVTTACREKFKYINDFARHLKLKHKSSDQNTFSLIRNQIKMPHKMTKLTCPFCFTIMPDNEALEKHVRQHEEISKSVHFKERLSEFISILINTTRCPTCDCEMRDLRYHCNHELAKNEMSVLKCKKCPKEFYSKKLYNNHLALEHGQCFICSSTFAHKTVLCDHIRSHLSQSFEHSCGFCNDILHTKADLLDHLKVQHSERCCSYCNEWFVEADELNHHIRYVHADKKLLEEKCRICDSCGASFKNAKLYESHQLKEHTKRKIFTCSVCPSTFRFRYLLMDHLSGVHKRTIVDQGSPFYKCYVCSQGFASQMRKDFIEHLQTHVALTTFCSDCNVNVSSYEDYKAHRERSHHDFSILVKQEPAKKATASINKAAPNKQRTPVKVPSLPVHVEETPSVVEPEHFSNIDCDEQQIMVQTEDGSLLNMNNFILTENGEFILQNMDGLLPHGAASADDQSGIHISNLEEFLMEQGLSSGAEISYVHSDEGQAGQVIIQNEDGTVSQSSQESLMQNYKEIFEPDEEMPTEMIITTEEGDGGSQTMLFNGDYIVQTLPVTSQSSNESYVQQTGQVDANQSTLDELGDILLEVAAAADKEKKPLRHETNSARESLWGKKRPANAPLAQNGSAKKRFGKQFENLQPEKPASNFSQAYEFFVKGFDAKKKSF